MKTIPVTEFKAHCLQLLDEVSKTGEKLIITKHGRPLADIGPHAPLIADYTPGKFAGTVQIVGDLIAPLDAEWDALK